MRASKLLIIVAGAHLLAAVGCIAAEGEPPQQGEILVEGTGSAQVHHDPQPELSPNDEEVGEPLYAPSGKIIGSHRLLRDNNGNPWAESLLVGLEDLPEALALLGIAPTETDAIGDEGVAVTRQPLLVENSILNVQTFNKLYCTDSTPFGQNGFCNLNSCRKNGCLKSGIITSVSGTLDASISILAMDSSLTDVVGAHEVLEPQAYRGGEFLTGGRASILIVQDGHQTFQPRFRSWSADTEGWTKGMWLAFASFN